MLRRYQTGYADGQYSLVAGHVEAAESLKSAAVRESLEEVGVDLNFDELHFFHLMYRRTLTQDRVDVFFSAQKWQGEIKNMEPEKCDDLKWFDAKNLPTNTLDYVKAALNERAKGNMMSEWIEE